MVWSTLSQEQNPSTVDLYKDHALCAPVDLHSSLQFESEPRGGREAAKLYNLGPFGKFSKVR